MIFTVVTCAIYGVVFVWFNRRSRLKGFDEGVKGTKEVYEKSYAELVKTINQFESDCSAASVRYGMGRDYRPPGHTTPSERIAKWASEIFAKND